jgi:hypothetical protein
MPVNIVIPEGSKFIEIEGIPILLWKYDCFAYDVPNGRRYNGSDAIRNGKLISREEWEKLVAEHAK